MKNQDYPKFLESIRVVDRSIPFLAEHFHRISHIISFFRLDKKFLSLKQLGELVLENAQTLPSKEVKVRLTLQLENNKLTVNCIESEPIDDFDSQTDIPIYLTIYDDGLKDSLSPFSNFKTDNRMLYIDSLLAAKDRGCDQSIILNERNEIVETSICNIFFQKGEWIYTPPLSSGCVDGIMRRITILEKGVLEKTIPKDSLGEFDSIFLTNAVRGLRKACVL